MQYNLIRAKGYVQGSDEREKLQKLSFTAEAESSQDAKNTGADANESDLYKDIAKAVPGGKELLLTDKGIFITCKEDEIFINLVKNEGIEIQSNKPITVASLEAVNVLAGTDINIIAKKYICIGTEGAFLEMTDDTATLAAENVIIN